MEGKTESRLMDIEPTIDADSLSISQSGADTLGTLNSTSNATVETEISCLMQISTQSQFNFSGCPVELDLSLCWPQTSSNTTAIVRCFGHFNGIDYDETKNVSRFCHANGTWDSYTNYSQCIIDDNNTDSMDRRAQIFLAAYIYIGGYILSLVALSLGLAVFIHFKDLRCLRNTIHANLFVTYILSALFWMIILIFMELPSNEATDIGCKCLVISLHYFNLANFFWMLVEGLYLYVLVVETFSGDNIKFKMYAFIGWGCPAIIIGIWTFFKVFVPDAPDPNLAPSNCEWLSESIIDWIFHGPKMACLLINLFFLTRIMWVLIIKLRSANSAEKRQYKKASKALLVLIPLLGITYLIVMNVPEDGTSGAMFNALRAFLISTQGFSVAMLYCFLNSEVKQALHHRINNWREERNIGMDTQTDYRKHRNGLSKEYSSPRSRTESIRLTSNGSSIP